MNYWKMSTLALTVALTSVVVVSHAHADAPQQPQPAMHAAIKNLEEAKTNLKNATADKGGFRVRAITEIDLAIDDVKRGIEFDNKR